VLKAGPSKRELQAKETRRRIFAAAAELISTRGYHAVTVAEIAKRAKVAKGTFFLHFATKDAIVTELVRIQTRAARRARADALASGEPPLSRLRITTLTLGEHAGASLELSRAVLAATLESREIGGATGALFDEVFAEMRVDSIQELGDDDLARALMTSYLGAALHVCSSPKARPLREVLEALVDTQLDAFIIRSEAPHARSPRRNVRHPLRSPRVQQRPRRKR
jgi:AcrR family transcriptional regulator